MIPSQEQIAYFMTHGRLQDDSISHYQMSRAVELHQQAVEEKKWQNTLVHGETLANDPNLFDEEGNMR